MPPSDAATNAPGTTSAATPVAGYWPGTPTEEETVAEAATAAAPGDEVRARPGCRRRWLSRSPRCSDGEREGLDPKTKLSECSISARYIRTERALQRRKHVAKIAATAAVSRDREMGVVSRELVFDELAPLAQHALHVSD